MSWESSVRPRKWQIVVEQINAEAGVPAPRSVTRAAAVAIFDNPLAAGQNDDELFLLVAASDWVGVELAQRAVSQLPLPAVAYGKAAIVGLQGDIEHAAAVLHPKLGRPMRNAVGGGKALIPSTAKVAAAGATIDIPLGHKDDAWSFDEIDTMSVSISDSPRPWELMLVVAFSDGGRPRPRLPK
jgi:hypothetical protein